MVTRETFKILDDKKQYVEIMRANDDTGFCLSDSGKAVHLPCPRYTGEFWCPVSLVRRHADDQSAQYGEAILVPVWFLMNNRISY